MSSTPCASGFAPAEGVSAAAAPTTSSVHCSMRSSTTTFLVLEKIGDRVEDVYERAVKDPSRAELDTIRLLKRELLFMRRAVWPLREVLSHLEHGETSLLRPDTLPYFRDVYDHVIQILETIETYREMLTSLMDVYLSSIANRTNEVMKVLTIITTLFTL